MNLTLSPIEDVIADYGKGRLVIIVDDADRENEGDLAFAAEKVTAEMLAFMMCEGRGLICVSISGELAAHLKLPLQTLNNNSAFNTQFAVSIDHRSVLGKGVTASSRATTIFNLISGSANAEDFISPGHVFPLIANSAGVVGRQGQTEGSFDLARMAGLKAAGVICEILNPDGTMMRGQELWSFATRHALKITSVEEILKYRVSKEVLLTRVAESQLLTKFGPFRTYVFEDDVSGKEHLALVYGNLDCNPLVRVHSECLTGDVFGSRRCDCGAQLDLAMGKIVENGSGVVLYMRQEGRGIGLANKLRAYELQDQGHDTVEANLRLGFEADRRNYVAAARILQSLELSSIRLMTNNPRKIKELERFGVSVSERVPVPVEADEYSQAYLKTKRDKLGHLL